MFRVNKMMCRAGLWTVIICCVASYKLYDEKRAIDLEGDDIAYEEEYSDPEQYPLRPILGPMIHPAMDLLSYNMYYPLNNLRQHYRPKFSMAEYPLPPFGYLPAPELLDLQAVAKKASEDNGSPLGHKMKPVIPKQPKWKDDGRKKNRALCFFKVCSFQPL